MHSFVRIVSVLLTALFLAGCGSAEDPAADAATATATEASTEADSTNGDLELLDTIPGVRLVSAADGATIADNPPDDLVILDVRTPDEFNDGHIEGAIMLDFYAADFAQKIAELDPDVPYLLYCNSGNRSGQTALFMDELGFTDVADVDGGIQAWYAAGLPTVTP